MKLANCLFASLLMVAGSIGYAQNPRAEIQQNKHFSNGIEYTTGVLSEAWQ